MGSAGSDAWWAGLVGPGDASCVEQDAEPVVLEGAEPMTAPFDFLHAEVQRFGRAVRRAAVMVSEDLGSPLSEGVAEDDELGNAGGDESGDGGVEEDGGIFDVFGEVDVAHVLLGEPRGVDLAVGVADAQAERESFASAIIEA